MWANLKSKKGNFNVLWGCTSFDLLVVVDTGKGHKLIFFEISHATIAFGLFMLQFFQSSAEKKFGFEKGMKS